ncbi:MAG: ABC transporter ATP-binding protein [Xanthobacteraceae bacterium]|nr:ABC transporter ATP-binding protein [Xanthobacteraceae bacterium]GIK82535.1 MAG: ABC transporter ATP-binding protein [Alphaproteobacteria bacterium]
MTSLEIRGVSVAYDELVAVRNVSLSAEAGSCVCILGANGAGKSSLLKSIVGLARIVEGEIFFEGESLKGVKPYEVAARGVMLCPEGRRLFPDLSVLENLKIGGHCMRRHRGTGSDLERIFAIFPRLQERRHQPAGSLSGGEQQMCAIGRALMSRPRLLLLDEPSLGLAPKAIADVAAVIRQIRQSGITVVLVEQNARLALRLSEFAFVLKSGELVREGPAAVLANDPEVAAAYLGG